jgi:hypothetical protein
MSLVALLLGFLLTSCTAWNQYTTPVAGEFPCHNTDHTQNPDAVWCYPVDKTHTCCPPNSACIPPDADGVSRGCAFQGDENFVTDNNYQTKLPVSRMSEQP